MTTSVPHFAFPFRVTPAGSVAVVEQDTLDEIAQCVEVIVRTREGERLELPTFGLRDLAFQVDLDTAAIVAEVEVWEPRAAVVVEEAPDRFDELIREMSVTVGRRGGRT